MDDNKIQTIKYDVLSLSVDSMTDLYLSNFTAVLLSVAAISKARYGPPMDYK